MRINSKGQITIPAEIRHQLGFHPGDTVDFSVTGVVIEVSKRADAPTRGERAVERLRGRATTSFTTDELMSMLRDDDDAA